MKKLLIIIFLSMPIFGMAQSGWERVLTKEEQLEQAEKAKKEAKKAEKAAKKAAKEAKKKGKESTITTEKFDKTASNDTKADKNKKYLLPNAVPEEEGKIIFTLDIDVPGKSARQIYDKLYSMLDAMAKEENQINSGIVLVNKSEHVIAAKYSEWLEFSRNFFVLDRTEFNYTIIATCNDNHLRMTFERISYNYEEGRDTGFMLPAEKVISDEYALNKNKTKLIPLYAKFRRKTIDRKDEIFQNVKDRLL